MGKQRGGKLWYRASGSPVVLKPGTGAQGPPLGSWSGTREERMRGNLGAVRSWAWEGRGLTLVRILNSSPICSSGKEIHGSVQSECHPCTRDCCSCPLQYRITLDSHGKELILGCCQLPLLHWRIILRSPGAPCVLICAVLSKGHHALNNR